MGLILIASVLAPAALTFRREELQHMRFAHMLQFLPPLWRGKAARFWTESQWERRESDTFSASMESLYANW